VYVESRQGQGAGDASPVIVDSRAFNSSSVKVVNPQPVWLRSIISVVEHASRNDELSENIFGYRGSAGSNNLDVSMRVNRHRAVRSVSSDREGGICPIVQSRHFRPDSGRYSAQIQSLR
jgi:hypothetical protein